MGESFTELALHSRSTPTTVTTADGTSLQSVNTFGGTADFDNQIIKGIFKLSVQSDLIIRTFASDTHSNEGFGRDIVTDGTFAHTDYEADVYVVAEFWKIG